VLTVVSKEFSLLGRMIDLTDDIMETEQQMLLQVASVSAQRAIASPDPPPFSPLTPETK